MNDNQKLLCLLIGFFNAGSVLAGSSQQSINVRAAIEYDDNPSMVATAAEDVWKYRLIPDYKLLHVKDEDELALSVSLILERSSDQNISDDREDPSVSLQWTRMNPLGQFSILAAYAEASTRVSEYEDTGDVISDATRTNYNLGLDWAHAISERLQLNTNIGYRDVAYEGSGSFTDYSDTSLGLSFNYQLDELKTPYIRLTASQYDPDQGLSESSEQYGLVAGVEWRLSEFFNADFNAGKRYTQATTDDSGWSASAIFNYEAELLSADFSYSRSSDPSGSGGYADADNIRLGLGYEWSDYSNLQASLNWRQNQSDTNDTETLKFNFALNRQLSEFWTLSASYQFNQRDTETTSADGNIAMMSVVYNMPKL